MEAEARTIIEDAVTGDGRPDGLMLTILDRFADAGGVELNPPSRSTAPRAPDLSS